MGFTEAIQHVFKHYADFKGRARRSEYWFFALFNLIVSSALGAIGSVMANLLPLTNEAQISMVEGRLSSIWGLIVLIPGLALCVRRLHDIGKSGWSYFIILVPLAGWIIYLVWVCQDSQRGANQYGDSPKYPANVDPYGNPYQPQGNYYNPQPPQGTYYNPQQPNNYYSPVQPNQPPVQQQYPSYQQPIQPVQPTAAPTEPQVQDPAVSSQENSNTGYDSPYYNQE